MEYIDENSTQIINEGYKIWKKHCPCLYNCLQSYELQTGSQTTEWFSESYIENSWKCSNLLIGTNSLANNSLMRLNVFLPTDQSIVDTSAYQQYPPLEKVTQAGYVGTMGQQQLNVKTKIHQNSEVMKARICKAGDSILSQNLIAVKLGGSTEETAVYNINYQDYELQENKVILKGHKEEGFGLDWNKHQKGLLASCSLDGRLIVWDVAADSKKQVEPFWMVENTSEGLPEDIKWSYQNKNVFAVSYQNRLIHLYDIREKSKSPAVEKNCHSGEVYCLSFNRMAQSLLLSGSEEGDIYLWDVRNMSQKLHNFIGHNNSVTCLQWSPHKQSEFVSGSADRKIVVWDVEKMASEPKKSVEALQGRGSQTQIKFIHGGHRSRITDVSYNDAEQNIISSCEEDRVMQVWQMTDSLLGK